MFVTSDLMHSIESIIDRLSSMDQKLDDFNDRFDQLDKKFTNKCEELEATLVSKASTERLHELAAKIKQLEGDLAAAKSDEIVKEAYNKRLNLLVHGVPESVHNIWELREVTLQLFIQLITQGLKLNTKQINIIDIYRLPQRPIFNRGTRVTRPTIVKLGSVFDKNLIFSSCKHLKTYNLVRLAETEKAGTVTTMKPVFITDHLPSAFQKQKKALLPQFKKAREEKKKTSWKIMNEKYCLFIDNKLVSENDY